MGPQKAPQALRWLERISLKNQGSNMDLQKALQALRCLESSTSQNQGPENGPPKSAASTAMARCFVFVDRSQPQMPGKLL